MRKLIFIPFLLFVFSGIAEAQIVVKVKPVAPKVVVVKPLRPGPKYVWIEGHWKLDKKTSQYKWVEAHWVKAKKSSIWIDGHWIETTGGWKWIPGHWKRR